MCLSALLMAHFWVEELRIHDNIIRCGSESTMYNNRCVLWKELHTSHYKKTIRFLFICWEERKRKSGLVQEFIEKWNVMWVVIKAKMKPHNKERWRLNILYKVFSSSSNMTAYKTWKKMFVWEWLISIKCIA